MNPEKNFLQNKYDLHSSEEVEKASERTEKRGGESVPEDPTAQIENYLERFEEILERDDSDKRERGIEAFKKILYRDNVLTEETIPESYFEQQKRIIKEQGHGDVEISSDHRSELSEAILSDQKASLDHWVDYLASDDAPYPTWFKYYVMRNVLKLGSFDKEKEQFRKRSKNTTGPFADLNREALSRVADYLVQKQEKGIVPDSEEWKDLLEKSNFSEMYTYAIGESVKQLEGNEVTDGEWVKYDQGSDHTPLVRSLQGYGTGWCTAGESTAEMQLKGGDFYVYYSNDTHGNPVAPRVAIRMQENGVAEVRGVARDQNLEGDFEDIANDKLSTLHGGEVYSKKSEDMKRLTGIYAKNEHGEELNAEDLRFLYEMDGGIDGFGYDKDPRIEEIREGRDVKEDISFITGYAKDEISTTKEEALSGDIKYHYGDLNLRGLTSAEGLTLPESVGGDLYLHNLTSAEGLTLPESVGGGLHLPRLTSAEGLTLPESVGGGLYLRGLTSAEGLTLPESVGGGLYLPSLTSAEGLTFPESVGGEVYLNALDPDEKNNFRITYSHLKIY